jgi:predicted esterase
MIRHWRRTSFGLVAALLTAWLVALHVDGQTTAPAPAGGATEPASKPSNQALAAWKELFAKDDPAAATEQLDAVLKALGPDVTKLKDMIASDGAYPAQEPGWLIRKLSVKDGATDYPVDFYVRVPRGYSPQTCWPTLLVAHGQDSDGKQMGRMASWLLGTDVDKYIIVSPTMPGDKVFNGKSYQEQAHLQPLAWARRYLNVDADRVYISGYSQGGHMSWHLATMFGQEFAAALPMSGVPWFEPGGITSTMYLENLATVPLWAIWGEKDKAADPSAVSNVDFCRLAAARLKELKNDKFKGTEIAGGGHGDCAPSPTDFAAFLAGNKRQATPATLTHVFHLATHSRSYYLQAIALARPPIDFTKPIKVTVTDPSEAMKAMEEYVRKNLFQMSAQLDAAKNAITIKGKEIKTIRLYVTEGMFDLSKPVTIKYWSKTWTGKITPSAKCMLINYSQRRDKSALIYNEVDLEIGGKMTVKYPDGKE